MNLTRIVARHATKSFKPRNFNEKSIIIPINFIIIRKINTQNDTNNKSTIINDINTSYNKLIDESTNLQAQVADVVVQTPELGHSIPQYIMYAIETAHLYTGLPYWETIIGITVLLRIMLIPISVKAVINGARMAVLRPDMQKLTDQFNSDPNSSDLKVRAKFSKEMQALFVKHRVNPFHAMMMPLIQAPIFISFFLALQSMGTYFPLMSSGGAFWFVDLTAPDPYYIFPVINALTFLIMIEIGADGMQSDPNMQGAKWGMRGLSLIILPATVYMPQSVCVYWTTTNTFSILQALLLKQPYVKKLLNIPELPKVAPALKIINPLTSVMDSIRGEKVKEETPPPPPVLTFSKHPKFIKKKE